MVKPESSVEKNSAARATSGHDVAFSFEQTGDRRRILQRGQHSRVAGQQRAHVDAEAFGAHGILAQRRECAPHGLRSSHHCNPVSNAVIASTSQ